MARLANPDLAERRRRQILEAAVACFRRRGFHQASMAEICGEAGLSAGALYRYFPSKGDLIAAIIEDERRAAEVEVSALKEAGGDIAAVLAAIGRSALARFIERDRRMIAEVMAEAARDPTLAAKLEEIWQTLRAQIAEAVARAARQSAGGHACPPDQLARLFLAAVDGIGFRLVFLNPEDFARGVDDLRVLAERLVRPVLREPALSAELTA